MVRTGNNGFGMEAVNPKSINRAQLWCQSMSVSKEWEMKWFQIRVWCGDYGCTKSDLSSICYPTPQLRNPVPVLKNKRKHTAQRAVALSCLRSCMSQKPIHEIDYPCSSYIYRNSNNKSSNNHANNETNKMDNKLTHSH